MKIQLRYIYTKLNKKQEHIQLMNCQFQIPVLVQKCVSLCVQCLYEFLCQVPLFICFFLYQIIFLLSFVKIILVLWVDKM